VSATPLSPSRQVIFHQMLVAARKTALMDALSEALGLIDPKLLKKQISRYVPKDAQKLLAAAGIRDEHVFPVPAILERQPTCAKSNHEFVVGDSFWGAIYGTDEDDRRQLRPGIPRRRIFSTKRPRCASRFRATAATDRNKVT